MSAIYNEAIATSSIELIVHAVIVLSITDLDDMVDTVLMIISHLCATKEEDNDDQSLDLTKERIETS